MSAAGSDVSSSADEDRLVASLDLSGCLVIQFTNTSNCFSIKLHIHVNLSRSYASHSSRDISLQTGPFYLLPLAIFLEA